MGRETAASMILVVILFYFVFKFIWWMLTELYSILLAVAEHSGGALRRGLVRSNARRPTRRPTMGGELQRTFTTVGRPRLGTPY